VANKDELEITIDADGNVSIKVIGGDGGGCVELTKELEEALGLVTKRTKTEEFYQETVEEDAQIEQQGE
jgi:hypothetical protein